MIKLSKILKTATDKTKFTTLESFLDFSEMFLEYTEKNLQAIIISQNENHYQFFQYAKEGNFQISRPLNSNLMYGIDNFDEIKNNFLSFLKNAKNISQTEREILNRGIYTLQQSIGIALDALPAGKSNTARKLNGDIFEHFIRLIIQEIGIDCESGVVQVPVKTRGKEQFKMSYQHDLIVKNDDDIKFIGSIKTSSKDRIDKIFIDKFLYNKLTSTKTPHIAIFLNDVQRKKTKKENQYGINATFLPGHFKGYTIKLNSLDGVYYCDIRPNMTTDKLLKKHIKTFDHLICEDIWKFL
jgi:hypothetical protein